MKIRIALVLVCLVTLGACASPDKPPSREERAALPESPGGGAPFAGIGLVDAERTDAAQGGARVLGVVAGPAAVAGLRSNDVIMRIDNIEVDAVVALDMIQSSSPGDHLELDVIRGTTRMSITLVIDERESWETPSAFSSSVPFAAAAVPKSAQAPDRVMPRVLSAAPQTESVVTRLDRMLANLARDDRGYHKLPLIRAAMANPASMNRWRDELTETLRPFEPERHAVIATMCKTLALVCPTQADDTAIGAASLDQFARLVGDANRQVRAVFDAAGTDRSQAHVDLHYLLQTTAVDRTLIGQPDVLRGIRAMQLSMRVDLAALLTTAAKILSGAAHLPHVSGKARQVPPELQEIIEGSIVDYIAVDAGYIVIGGPESNRYDMNRIYAVIDTGGNDTYYWGDDVPLETQTIFDLAGNDRYQAKTGGPGAGWIGVAVLIDAAGSDHYESALGGCGAGAFGFGFLFDDAGNDTYRCAAWSAGAGIYGGGALIDHGEHTDVYESQVFSQGVGGPRGMGLLIDTAGGDFYRANGPIPSAYDTPGSFMAFSQGVGVGIRPYDYGGVGVLLDFGGDDRYEGGEFSQGGGYYWGLGLLRDESGNDLYFGNRYAQGFAAHQAFGMLTDMSGDDVYWSMSAAGQGAAWDQSIAILFEGGGNDVYRAQSLSQGAAAQQARAMLHDVGGDDVYWSSGRNTQGAAGDNSYHFQADDPVYSLGVLLDERGDDRYSTGLDNGAMLLRHRTGSKNGNGVAGIAIDVE